MQYGTGHHRNGTGNIVFLDSEQIADKTGQRRHSEQQHAKAPIPAGIKKIACARKENNPLFFLPEYIPVQKKKQRKKRARTGVSETASLNGFKEALPVCLPSYAEYRQRDSPASARTSMQRKTFCSLFLRLPLPLATHQ